MYSSIHQLRFEGKRLLDSKRIAEGEVRGVLSLSNIAGFASLNVKAINDEFNETLINMFEPKLTAISDKGFTYMGYQSSGGMGATYLQEWLVLPLGDYPGQGKR